MGKRFKKVLSAVLAVAILFGAAGAGLVGLDSEKLFAPKASAASVEDLKYEITDGEVTITGYNPGTLGELIIPATIEGKPVTSIYGGMKSIGGGDGGAFEGCTSLTSVTIPDSVTSIGCRAFRECTRLTNVAIPDSVTSIGWDAFDGTEIYNDAGNWENGVLYIGNHLIKAKSDVISGDYTIKAGTKTIAGHAFWKCTSLTSVTIPDGVTSIGYKAFRGCESLKSVTIPDSVTSIGRGAFLSCTSLTSVTIPDSVTSIGEDAFSGCKSLTSATIPDSVTSIGYAAFSGCKSLTSVTIPDSVTSVGDRAFENCTSLTSVTIPDSVTSIGQSAFDGCSSLMSVTIPDGATSIGWYAFDGCSALTDVYYGGSESNWGNIKMYPYNDPLWNANVHYNSSVFGKGGNAKKSEKFFAPEASAASVEDLTYKIENGKVKITNCDESASGELVIPAAIEGKPVTSIGDEAFEDCKSLTSVTIGDGITSIGDYAFEDCESLTSVTIGDGVTSIGYRAFFNCTSLTAITVDENNPGYCDIDGVLFNKDKTILIQYPAKKTATKYTIPDGVTSIGYAAFSGCTSLTNVTIPDGVTEIGGGAFYNCKKLTSVTIPDGVTEIGGGAFYNCKKLTSVTIGNGVTSIGYGAFTYCANLTSVNIPDSVTSIGEGAFIGCSALTDVYYGGSESDWRAIAIDNEENGNAPLWNAHVHYNSPPPKSVLGTGALVALIVILTVVVAAVLIVVIMKKKTGRSTRP